MYAGYNPAMRGHMIRYNYFHHVYGFEGRGCNGVYLDDMFCSATIFGNVFYQVPRAAFIGGGHDNVVENNIFVDCKPALHVDARMMGWAAASVPIMKQRLEEVPYQEEPWRSRYPATADLPGGQLRRAPGQPRRPQHLLGRPLGRDRGQGQARASRWRTTWSTRTRSSSTPRTATSSCDPTRRPGSSASSGSRSRRSACTQDPLRVTWPVVTDVRYPDNMPQPASPPDVSR